MQDKIKDKNFTGTLRAKNSYKNNGTTNFKTGDWFRDDFIDGIVLFKSDVSIYRVCNGLELNRTLKAHPEFKDVFGIVAANMAVLCHLNLGIYPDKDNAAFILYFDKQIGFLCGSLKDMFLERSEVLDEVIELTKLINIKELPKPWRRVQDYVTDGKNMTPSIRGKLRGKLRNAIFDIVQDALPTKHKMNSKELTNGNVKPDGNLRAKTQGPANSYLEEEYGLIGKASRTLAGLQMVYDELKANSDESITQATLLNNVDESRNVVQRCWSKIKK